MPLPRNVGPLHPNAIAASTADSETPLVRSIQRRLLVSRSWYSRRREGISLRKVAHAVLEVRRQVGLEAAGHDVAGHHAHAGAHLEDVEDHLALAEAVEEDALRPEVQRAGPEPDEVAGDAL